MVLKGSIVRHLDSVSVGLLAQMGGQEMSQVG